MKNGSFISASVLSVIVVLIFIWFVFAASFFAPLPGIFSADNRGSITFAVLTVSILLCIFLAVHVQRLINEQRMTETAVNEKEKRLMVLQKAVEDSASHVILTDENGTITYANQSAQKITGYSLEEMIGKTPRLWKSGKMLENTYGDFWKTIKTEKKPFKGEFVNKKKNGELYTVAATVSPIIEEGELTGFIGTEVDITDRVRWEEKLKLQKDELIAAQRIAKTGNFNWDLKTNVVIWSIESFRIHGFTPTEDLHPPQIEKYFRAVHPDDRKEAEKSLNEAVNKKGVNEFVYRVVWDDGSIHWVRLKSSVDFGDKGESLIMKGTFQDITKEVEDTDKIEQERVKDEAILSSIADGLFMVDQNGTIELINNAAENIFGYKKGEVLGKKITDVFPIKSKEGNGIESDKRPALMSLQSQKVSTGIYQYTRKDKSSFPAAITVAPVILHGKAIGAIEVFRDVTREQNVDRMKTEFISLASHQLRTPLSAIKWFIEILQDGNVGELTAEQKEMTTNIELSNERMIALVNALLNVSRIESGRIIVDPQPTDMKKLIEEVIKEVKPKISAKKQKLILSIHENLPVISIDPDMVRQVYLNLLTNANKYTPNEGEITIIISKKGEEIISQISDNGYGIPLKDHAKVFEKFYRGDNVMKLITDGNGLGLYLVKAIVESSGGRIWFTSEENKGTSFMFSIPLSGSVARAGEVKLNS